MSTGGVGGDFENLSGELFLATMPMESSVSGEAMTSPRKYNHYKCVKLKNFKNAPELFICSNKEHFLNDVSIAGMSKNK